MLKILLTKLNKEKMEIQKKLEYWLQASKADNQFVLITSVWKHTKDYNKSMKIFETTKNENRKANYYFKKAFVQCDFGFDKDDIDILNKAINNFKLSENQFDFVCN